MDFQSVIDIILIIRITYVFKGLATLLGTNGAAQYYSRVQSTWFRVLCKSAHGKL